MKCWVFLAVFGFAVAAFALPVVDLEEDDDEGGMLDSINSIPLPLRTGASGGLSAYSAANSFNQQPNAIPAAIVGGAIGAGYGYYASQATKDLADHIGTSHKMNLAGFQKRFGNPDQVTVDHIESAFGISKEEATSVYRAAKTTESELTATEFFVFLSKGGDDALLEENELVDRVYVHTPNTPQDRLAFAKAFLTGRFFRPSLKDIFGGNGKVEPLYFVPKTEYDVEIGTADAPDVEKLQKLFGFGSPEEWKATIERAAKGITIADISVPEKLWRYLAMDGVDTYSKSLFTSPQHKIVISRERFVKKIKHSENQVKG